MTRLRVAAVGDEIGLPVIADSVARAGVDLALVVASGRRRPPVSLGRYGVRTLVLGGPLGESQSDLRDRMVEVQANVLVCFSFDQILTPDVLATPDFGAWNVHGGLLPKHRGANALNWVLILGETETAVTMHEMVAQVDAGPILVEEVIQIDPHTDALELRCAMVDAAQRIIPEGLRMIASGNAPTRPQSPSTAAAFRRRTPEDGRIDWSMSDREIHNLIRGLVNPWPGAWTIAADGVRVAFPRYLTIDEVRAARQRYGSPGGSANPA